MANYLYNGIELPALPEWDKETYPYALIAVQYGNYTLSASDVKQSANIAGTDIYTSFTEDARYISFSLKEGVWTNGTKEYTAIGGGNYGRIGAEGFVWANHDIYEYQWTSYSEPVTPLGTVLLATSDPVPVTETDHNARIMGWIVGKRLAAMRGNA